MDGGEAPAMKRKDNNRTSTGDLVKDFDSSGTDCVVYIGLHRFISFYIHGIYLGNDEKNGARDSG